MAYTLGNKCAKNLCTWTVLLQLIIKNVVTFFGTQCRTPNYHSYTVLTGWSKAHYVIAVANIQCA